jgi:hypothetical protein
MAPMLAELAQQIKDLMEALDNNVTLALLFSMLLVVVVELAK